MGLSLGKVGILGQHPHFLFVSLIWIGLLTLWSCEFDHDLAYYPVTHSTYLLVADSSRTQPELVRIDASYTLTRNWAQSLGIPSLAAIDGWGDQLWVADPAGHKIWQVDLAAEQVAAEWSLDNFQAHGLCAGTDYLLIWDTLALQIGFFHKEKGNLHTIALNEKPGRAIYRSRKFYLSLNDTLLTIYHEQAFAPLASWAFERPIVDMTLDNALATYVFTTDGQLHQSRIRYHDDQRIESEIPVAFDKIRFSPYKHRPFGKEFLSTVRLDGQKINLSQAPNAQDFVMDFFESRLYTQARDSLFVFPLSSRAVRALGPLSGRICKAYFFQASIGQ